MNDLFGGLAPARQAIPAKAPQQPPIGTGYYGPQEAALAIPMPWGAGTYQIARSSITGLRDAGDGRTWLTLSRVAEPILVEAAVEKLVKAAPSLSALAPT